MYRQSEKSLLNSNTSSTCADNMVKLRPQRLRSVGEFGAPLQISTGFVSRLGSVIARHSSSGCQPNCGVEQRALPTFGRAAITLGIGPHF